MNEFQILSQQQEMDALKAAVSSFDVARPQPFLSPPDSDVQAPSYNKTSIPQRLGGGQSGNDGTSISTIPCVIGINEGGTFRVVLANVVGPITEIP